MNAVVTVVVTAGPFAWRGLQRRQGDPIASIFRPAGRPFPTQVTHHPLSAQITFTMKFVTLVLALLAVSVPLVAAHGAPGPCPGMSDGKSRG